MEEVGEEEGQEENMELANEERDTKLAIGIKRRKWSMKERHRWTGKGCLFGKNISCRTPRALGVMEYFPEAWTGSLILPRFT